MKQESIDLGGFNDFPPQWREISVKEYAYKVECNTILKVERRQIVDRAHRSIAPLSVTLLIFQDGTGVASSSVYEHIGSGIFDYDHVSKFYAFGCPHEWKEISWNRRYGTQFNGLHLWKCIHCNKEWVVDSSG